MDRQKQIFEKLGFGPFLANLTTILFLPRKEKGDVFYASANYKVQEPNYTRPDDHRNYFEHDVIMTVVHCGERIDKGRTRRKIVSKFVVSIEIKTSVDDIWKSSIDKYLGATRLFFIAAPKLSMPTPGRSSCSRSTRTSRRTGATGCWPAAIRASTAIPFAAGTSSRTASTVSWKTTVPLPSGPTAAGSA